jgi:hypothetical protein
VADAEPGLQGQNMRECRIPRGQFSKPRAVFNQDNVPRIWEHRLEFHQRAKVSEKWRCIEGLIVVVFRLWFCSKDAGDTSEPQQLGYLSVVPTCLSAAGMFSKPKFENFAQTVDRINEMFRQNPIPGQCDLQMMLYRELLYFYIRAPAECWNPRHDHQIMDRISRCRLQLLL